ncbi:hypothetical protein C8R44DRAFT_727220 [Mycena epipterygia]|nr:hypothetical protein C8R44DRAFT_727220 [Mycena epipterygia]
MYLNYGVFVPSFSTASTTIDDLSVGLSKLCLKNDRDEDEDDLPASRPHKRFKVTTIPRQARVPNSSLKRARHPYRAVTLRRSQPSVNKRTRDELEDIAEANRPQKRDELTPSSSRPARIPNSSLLQGRPPRRLVAARAAGPAAPVVSPPVIVTLHTIVVSLVITDSERLELAVWDAKCEAARSRHSMHAPPPPPVTVTFWGTDAERRGRARWNAYVDAAYPNPSPHAPPVFGPAPAPASASSGAATSGVSSTGPLSSASTGSSSAASSSGAVASSGTVASSSTVTTTTPTPSSMNEADAAAPVASSSRVAPTPPSSSAVPMSEKAKGKQREIDPSPDTEKPSRGPTT